MKKTMNMPGFTAEAALAQSDGRYQALAEAAVYGGLVEPAAHVSTPGHPLYCLKFKCLYDPANPSQCRWHTTVGIVDPVTGDCM